MTATRKSKVNESLGKVLSKNRSAESKKSPKPENKTESKNVTHIDSALEIVDTDGLTGPFAEAEIERAEEVFTVSSETEDGAPVLEVKKNESIGESSEKPLKAKPKIEAKSKPERVRSKKVKRTPSQQGGSKTLSGAAIVLSFIAIVGSGYSILSQSGIQKELAEGLAAVEMSVVDITDRTDIFQTSLSDVKQTVSDNSAELSKLQDIDGSVREITQTIDLIQEKVNQVSDQIELSRSTLDGHGKLISSLQADVKKLNARPKPVVRKTVTKPALVKKPVSSNSNSVEGATLATVDRWGVSSYVMLRSPEGVWVPLQRGDKYKGWKFTGFTGEKALFKKGSTIKKLTLES